jgi:hypothetical protein
VRVALDDENRVSALEEVSISIVPSIEKLRVAAVHQFHAEGQVRLLRLDDQVIVARHQAVRMAGPVVPSDDRAQQRQECFPVAIVEEDLAMIGSTIGDLKDAVWKLASRLPWHASKLRDVSLAR